MGAFLFFLFKSTLCLAVLYLLFWLCFRGDTLFRTNRFLLLGGTAGGPVLPLVQGELSLLHLLRCPPTTPFGFWWVPSHFKKKKQLNMCH